MIPFAPTETRCRTRSGLRALLLSCLACATAPCLAAPLAADSADAIVPASTSQALAGSAFAPDRRMLSAADVARLIEAHAETGAEGAGDGAEAGEPEAPGRVEAVLQRAMGLLGTPYRWGGTSPDSGFDCSGLVGYVFRTALGIELPRVSREMAGNGERIERAALAAGDLVFFGRRGKRVDHVGIYVGDGQFVHAPSSGRDVTVSRLDTGYWAGRFLQARRVENLGG